MTVLLGKALDLLPKFSDGSIDFIYTDPPFATQKNKGDFDDRWESIEKYIEWLSPHVREYHRVLAPSGSLLIHLDWRAVHYARVEADKIFGYDNMLNEIIWNYNSGGAGSRFLARKHDNLLWYVKDPKSYTFNTLREPYATPNVQGRLGFHKDGRRITDVWPISFLSTTAKERTGYSTQKPLALMDRILEVFTSKGDVVMDPMCGSGSLAVSAKELGRSYVVMDRNPDAVKTTLERLGLPAISPP